MGRFSSLLLVFSVLLWFGSSALADGKIFPRGVAAPPPIPDQQAIIAWDAATATETLAIETRFAAAPSQSPEVATSAGASDSAYAWIVPLPGPTAPEISAASSGLFPTVRAIFQPRVFDNGPDTFGPLVFLTGMLLLGTWVSMRGKTSRLSSLVSILVVLLGVT